MRLFDTHAHLDLPTAGTLSERRSAVRRAKSAGILDILIPGVTPASWSELQTTAADLRAHVPSVRIHTAVGIHPYWVGDLNHLGISAIRALLSEAVGSAPSSLVAIGECGLDFGRRGDTIARSRQVALLDIHLERARDTGLPLLLHCVKAHAALLERLSAAPTPPCVLHSFSGSAELVKVYCRAGHYISFAGAITNPRARKPLAAARAVPDGQLLIETDCPDQTPFSRRGARAVRNEPAFLVDIAEATARARGTDADTVAAQTTANAYTVFGLSPHADPDAAPGELR